jgi:hypothetical protein
MSLTKLSLSGNNLIIPGQGEFGYSDIPANLFLQCMVWTTQKLYEIKRGGSLPPKTNGRNKLCLVGGGQIIIFFDPLRDRSMRSFFITLSCPACDTNKLFYLVIPRMYFLNFSIVMRIKENTPTVLKLIFRLSISKEVHRH